MQVAKVQSEKLKHQFKITAPAEDLQKKFDAQLQKVGAKARIPGFRPGKAPKTVLIQRYGSEAWEDAGNAILREAFSQIYKEHAFRNAVDPSVKVVSFEQGKDFECLVTFEVLPDVTVKDFKDISLEKLTVIIEDQDVEQRLKRMHEGHARYQEPADEGRGAQKADLVSVKWSGVLEDGKRIELPETYQILLGPEKNNGPFAPVVKALYGKKVGDCFEEAIQFSKDEKVSDLAGKTAKVNVEIQKIEEPIQFKLDDAFAKEFKSETLEDLRKTIRNAVEHESKKVAHLYMKRNLLDILDAQYEFDLPPTMVENEFKAIWNQLQRELAEARANGDMDEEDAAKSEEELKVDYETIAKRRVRLGLLIAHLAEQNKLELNDEEVRKAVFQEAMRYPAKMEEVIKFYVNNNQALRNLVAPLLEDKVVDFILSQSNLKEREIGFAALKKIVRGVIPTPYDEEDLDDTAEAPSKGSKASTTQGKKPEKPKADKQKGKGA